MEKRRRADDRFAVFVPETSVGGCRPGIRPELEQGGRLAANRQLLNKGKAESRPSPSRPSRKAAPPRPAKATGASGMSEAQSAYLQELAEEEGGDFDPDLTKEEGARRIGELLVKQMARRSPTEPPF
jgi:DUF3072 family protein